MSSLSFRHRLPDRSKRLKIAAAIKGGTRILDSKNHPVRLRGVNAASLEWTSNGEGHILQTANVAIRDWHVNIIRLTAFRGVRQAGAEWNAAALHAAGRN